MCPGFKSRRRCHMWVEVVFGSLLCSERFFSGYSGFPLSSKTNISKFQFDQESGRRRTTMWMSYLQIVIYLFILFILYRETQKGRSSSWAQARRKYRCYWRRRFKRYVDCCTLKLYLMANTVLHGWMPYTRQAHNALRQCSIWLPPNRHAVHCTYWWVSP